MCDMHCMVQGEVENGKLLRLKSLPEHPLGPTFCIKPAHALEYYDHEDRLLHPLKRKGVRGVDPNNMIRCPTMPSPAKAPSAPPNWQKSIH